MASVMRCDRCDKYFDENTIKRKPMNFNHESTVDKLMVSNDEFGFSAKYDLCDECWEKFFAWMDAWKVEEEVNPETYIEQDTKCDKCEYLTVCTACIEATGTLDTRRHYVRSRRSGCMKEEVIE